jgi:hypothetical protein
MRVPQQLVQIGLADLGDRPRVAVVIVELQEESALGTGPAECGEDVGEVEDALGERGKLQVLEPDVLKVHVLHPGGGAADGSRITDPGGQVRGVRA